jgi:hypothetical protein
MAEGQSALKEQALATLQAGRREISAEVQWLKNGLNPKRAVEHLTRDHTMVMLLGALALGIAVPLLFKKKRPVKTSPEPSHHWGADKAHPVASSPPVRPKVGMMSHLLGVLMKAATPFLLHELLGAARPMLEQALASHLPHAHPGARKYSPQSHQTTPTPRHEFD